MKAIKNIMIALSGIALLASCDMDKFFELDRPESNPWLSVDDLEYSVADPYNTLFQNPNWQAPIGIIPYYQELVADLSTVNPQGAYEQEALYWYPRQMSTFDVTGQQFEKTFSILYRSVTGATSPLFAERSSILVISTVGFVWSTVKLSVAYGSDTLLARSVALMVNV